jgi:CRISPR-associated protein Cas5d
MYNQVEFKVYGRSALFTDPVTKIGGEKCSYQIPTYEALKGITESIYWKPTFIWVIDELRVIKPIRLVAKNIKAIKYQEPGADLSVYTYLSDVEYRVRAHFEWNEKRPDLKGDRNDNKHYLVAKRMIERGGRRDIFLGARECQAYVEPCAFDEGEGFYDQYGATSFGLMFHSFGYPDELGESKLISRFWRPEMKNGVVKFLPPDHPGLVIKNVRKMVAHEPKLHGDLTQE